MKSSIGRSSVFDKRSILRKAFGASQPVWLVESGLSGFLYPDGPRDTGRAHIGCVWELGYNNELTDVTPVRLQLWRRSFATPVPIIR